VPGSYACVIFAVSSSFGVVHLMVKNMVFYSSPCGVIMMWQLNFKNMIFLIPLIVYDFNDFKVQV
jgi:hypothetical protein